MSLSRRQMLAALGAGALGGLTLAPKLARAHPYHVSIAQAHHRSASGRLEVSLRLTPEDLDAELGRRLGKTVDLSAQPFAADSELDRELARMLREDFRLAGPDGILYGLHLVGREVRVDEAWVYFELAAPPSLDGLTLFVGLLFELESSQENTVNLFRDPTKEESDRGGGPHQSLHFCRGDGPELL